MAKSVYVCDQDADVAIKTMMAAVVGTAVVPAHVNWALTASAMGAGAVAIAFYRQPLVILKPNFKMSLIVSIDVLRS